MKLTNVSSNLRLEKTRFLVINHKKQTTLCSKHFWNGKGRPEKLRPLQNLVHFPRCFRTATTRTGQLGPKASLNLNWLLSVQGCPIDHSAWHCLLLCLKFEVCAVAKYRKVCISLRLSVTLITFLASYDFAPNEQKN